MSFEGILKHIKALAIHKDMAKTRKKNTSKCNKAGWYIQETTNSLDSQNVKIGREQKELDWKGKQGTDHGNILKMIIKLIKIVMKKRSDYIKYHASFSVENELGGPKTISKVNNLSSVSVFQERAYMGRQDRGRAVNNRIPFSSYHIKSQQTWRSNIEPSNKHSFWNIDFGSTSLGSNFTSITYQLCNLDNSISLPHSFHICQM